MVYEKLDKPTKNKQVAGVDLGVNNLGTVTTNKTGIAHL